jgi:hypothetical protein
MCYRLAFSTAENPQALFVARLCNVAQGKLSRRVWLPLVSKHGVTVVLEGYAVLENGVIRSCVVTEQLCLTVFVVAWSASQGTDGTVSSA